MYAAGRRRYGRLGSACQEAAARACAGDAAAGVCMMCVDELLPVPCLHMFGLHLMLAEPACPTQMQGQFWSRLGVHIFPI